jgi:hypothetical protein
VTLTGATTPKPTFTAATGQTYNFLLTVKDDHGGQGQASVRISTSAANRAQILSFIAAPAQIAAGQAATLTWKTQNADTANIAGIGNVAVNGSLTVSPTQTTTYMLTARNSVNDETSSVTVTVTAGTSTGALPVISSFTATPSTINAGQNSTLQWSTQNATSVSISSIGTVAASGTNSVSPTVTTVYTLTASNATGSTTSTATVTVGKSGPVIVFSSDPLYTTSRDVRLDASGSSSPSGNTPLQFYWTVRSDKAVIYQRTSPTPQVYLPGTPGNYIFDLTVTDSKGNSTTKSLTVRLIGL